MHSPQNQIVSPFNRRNDQLLVARLDDRHDLAGS